LDGRVALFYTLAIIKKRRVGHEAPAFQVRGFIFGDHELSKMAPLYGNLDRGRSSITFWA
jgi:hypothetical protein